MRKPTCRLLRPGFVYLIRAENGLVKIGASARPGERLQTLNNASAMPNELLHQIATDDMIALEAHLHEQYTHRRVRGEWFALTAKDLDTLASIPRMEATAADVPAPRWGALAVREVGHRKRNADLAPCLKAVGSRIRALRTAKGLSQAQLARLIGTANMHLSRWERGLKIPSLSAAIALADYFGLSLDEMVGRAPPQT